MTPRSTLPAHLSRQKYKAGHFVKPFAVRRKNSGLTLEKCLLPRRANRICVGREARSTCKFDWLLFFQLCLPRLSPAALQLRLRRHRDGRFRRSAKMRNRMRRARNWSRRAAAVCWRAGQGCPTRIGPHVSPNSVRAGCKATGDCSTALVIASWREWKGRGRSRSLAVRLIFRLLLSIGAPTCPPAAFFPA